MELPTAEQVTDKRIGKFKQRITATLDTGELDLFRKMVEDYQHEYGVPVIEIAAALGALAQGKKPLQAKAMADRGDEKKPRPAARPDRAQGKNERPAKPREQSKPRAKTSAEKSQPDIGMERFRIEVGRDHEVQPGNIVGAIANEAEIDSEHIGRIEIHQDHSTVELPEGMPKEIFKHLKSVWVSGQRLQISRIDGGAKPASKPRKHKTTGGRQGQRGKSSK
jgi:ATP-dependent RNA helicase DeaD